MRIKRLVIKLKHNILTYQAVSYWAIFNYRNHSIKPDIMEICEPRAKISRSKDTEDMPV
jgi:hypothetical protein